MVVYSEYSRKTLAGRLPAHVSAAALEKYREVKELRDVIAACDDPNNDPPNNERCIALLLKYMFDKEYYSRLPCVKMLLWVVKVYVDDNKKNIPKPPRGFCKRPRDGFEIEIEYGDVKMKCYSTKRFHEAKVTFLRLLHGSDGKDAIRALVTAAWMYHIISSSGIKPGRLPWIRVVRDDVKADMARIEGGALKLIESILECEPVRFATASFCMSKCAMLVDGVPLSALREAFVLVKSDLKRRRDETQALTEKKLGTHGLVLRLALADKDDAEKIRKYKVQTDTWDGDTLEVQTVPGKLTFLRVRKDGLTKVAGAPYSAELEADALERMRELQSGHVEDVHALIKKVGAVTRRCVFCDKELKDESSVAAGIGPVCMKTADELARAAASLPAEARVPRRATAGDIVGRVAEDAEKGPTTRLLSAAIEALRRKDGSDDDGLLATLSELLDGDSDKVVENMARFFFDGDKTVTETAVQDVLLTVDHKNAVPAYNSPDSATRFARAVSLADRLGMTEPFVDWLAHRWSLDL